MLSTNSSVIVAIRMVYKVLNWCDTLSGLQSVKTRIQSWVSKQGLQLDTCMQPAWHSFIWDSDTPTQWHHACCSNTLQMKTCTELNKPQIHTHHDACCSLTLIVVQSTSDSSLTAVTMQHREVCSQDTSTQRSEIKTSMFFTHISLHHVDTNKQQIHSTPNSHHLAVHMSPHHSQSLSSLTIHCQPLTTGLKHICPTYPFPHSLQVPLGLTFHGILRPDLLLFCFTYWFIFYTFSLCVVIGLDWAWFYVCANTI